MHKRKSAFLRVIKSTLHYIMRPTTLHKTSCILATLIFENDSFPSTALQHRQHVYMVGCHVSFGGLISMFVFDILQIPSGCIQICRGCTALRCTSLATDLLRILPYSGLTCFF